MPSTHTFLDHYFPEAHRTWLDYAANAENFDPRNARAELFDQLPADFEPGFIDPRFYYNDRLTILGRRLFKPADSVLKNAEVVAISIRDEIRKNPGVNEITFPRIAELSGLSGVETHAAIAALTEIVPFFTGSAGASPSGPATYFFIGAHGYDAPLRFTTLEEAFERSYQRQASFFGSTTFAPDAEPNASVVTSNSKRLEVNAVSTRRATAFVIMAMDSSRPELVDVLETIRRVCATFGIKAHRSDEIQHQEQITNVILEEIRCCEYLIADLTHERPNVYYEIGYAHAIHKKPILYRRIGTPLHFDLAVHNVPEYRNNAELRELLTKRFEAILGRAAA